MSGGVTDTGNFQHVRLMSARLLGPGNSPHGVTASGPSFQPQQRLLGQLRLNPTLLPSESSDLSPTRWGRWPQCPGWAWDWEAEPSERTGSGHVARGHFVASRARRAFGC